MLFDFKGVVAFRSLGKLIRSGLSPRQVRKLSEMLRERFPDIAHPFMELRITAQGKALVVQIRHLRLTPEGQLLMDFEGPRRQTVPSLLDSIETLFVEGLKLESEEDWGGAEKRYELALLADPKHSDALVNMGNLKYRAGQVDEAEEYYRKALRSDPDHVEANYNLANILDEKDRLEDAVLFYLKTVHQDPDFADAHFNLGRAFEKLGEGADAKKHWEIYLSLDPSSEWAEYVKQRLEEME